MPRQYLRRAWKRESIYWHTTRFRAEDAGSCPVSIIGARRVVSGCPSANNQWLCGSRRTVVKLLLSTRLERAASAEGHPKITVLSANIGAYSL